MKFSLRTLLIVVAVLAVPCAYVGNAAHKAHERLAFLNAHPGSLMLYNLEKRPSWIKRLLHDPDADWVAMPLGSTKADREEAARLFPEAELNLKNPDCWMLGGKDFKAKPVIPFPD